MTSTHGYSLKSLKTFDGRDGGGLEAKLCRDGKVVAEVFNGAHGGPNEYHWVDQKGPTTPHTTVQANGYRYTHHVTAEEKRLLDAVATLPPIYGYGMAIVPDMDTFVGELVNRQKNAASFKRKLKAHLMYQVEGEDNIYTLKGAYSEALAQQLRVREGKPIVIFNERDDGPEAIYDHLKAVDDAKAKATYEAEQAQKASPPETVTTPSRHPRPR